MGWQIPLGTGNYTLYCVHVGCGTELDASPMCTWGVFPGLDDNKLPPPITELQKEWCHSSTLPYIFMARCWINPACGKYYTFIHLIRSKSVSDSSVGIVTDCGLDSPRSNISGDEIFRPSRPALGPAQPPGLSLVRVRPGRAADHSLPSSAAVMEE